MEIMEIEAKTIDEAIKKACQEFDVPREKLNIEILSEGSSGILGLGAKKAKIRAGILSLDMGIEKDSESTESKPVPKEEQTKKDIKGNEIRSEAGPTEAPANDDSIPERAKELLEGILKRMGLDFPFSIEETEDAVIFKISGDGSGILIGKGGETLDAIQYILNKAVNTFGVSKRRIVLDTEDYREKREEYLIALAEKLAGKVKKSGKPVTVNYMSARDRRIIHMALKDDDKLTTKSRGEGAYRKIIILPARKPGQQRQKRARTQQGERAIS